MEIIEQLTTQLNHNEAIGFVKGEPVLTAQVMQNFMDDFVLKLNTQLFGDGIMMKSYLVADLPAVPDITAPSMIYVSDEVGGAVPAFSDGTNWRRFTDRAVVS